MLPIAICDDEPKHRQRTAAVLQEKIADYGPMLRLFASSAELLNAVETEGYGHAFTDVSGHWAEPELGWPVHAGILSGVGEGRFDPDGVLTTEQAILMTWRALEALG